MIKFFSRSILPLILFISTQILFADPPEWQDNPGTYQFQSYISFGIVLSDDGQLGEEGDMFAAFDNAGNVRGVGLVDIFDQSLGDYAFTMVWEMVMRSNVDGDVLSFKYYDASNDAILDVNETYAFVTGQNNGDPWNPLIFNASIPDYGCPDCVDTAMPNGMPCSFVTVDNCLGGITDSWPGYSAAEVQEACPVTCETCPVEDECGVCEGDNSSCEDCEGVPNGDAVEDECGECGGDNYFDENGIFPNGNCDCDGNIEDECGVCGGGGIDEGACDCDGNVDLGCGCGEAGPSGCDEACGSGLEFDECGICGGDGSSCQEHTVDVLFDSDAAIAGFQYDIIGDVTVVGASGGAAADAGFVLSSGNNTVIGVSFTAGVTIPAGSGILHTLVYTGTGSPCISDLILSDSDGADLGGTIEDCLTISYTAPCDDIDADDICDDVDDCVGVYDECGICGGDGSSCQEYTADVLFDSDAAIAGFQFDVLGDVTVIGASGGAAADAGFVITTHNNGIIGVSLTGATIPAGSGILVALEYTGVGDPCLSDLILSDSGGVEMASTLEDCLTISHTAPCDDIDADDICDDVDDCVGVYDECDVCNGDGIADGTCDCAGNVEDACGICGGDGLSCGSIGYCLELHAGANLISFYGLPDDKSIGHIMSSIDGIATSMLGEGVAAGYNDEFGFWQGSLAQENISPVSGYWVIVNDACSLCLSDVTLTNPDIGYNLHEGANLISFPTSLSANLSDALPAHTEGLISSLLGEGVAAGYNNEFGFWQGSLAQEGFSGGNGYWMITTESISFSFNLSTGRIKIDDEVGLTAPDNKKIYQSTQQAFYFIEDVSLDGMPISNGDWILSYNGKNLVGARQWNGSYTDIPAMGNDGIIETTGYCNNSTQPIIKIQKNSTGKIYQVMDAIPTWKSNGIFNLGNLSAREMPDELLLVSAYPNPFNPITNITFGIENDGLVSVKVFDVSGREIADLAHGVYSAGYHIINWNADAHSSGLYFLTVTIDDFISGNRSHSVYTQKLMLLK